MDLVSKISKFSKKGVFRDSKISLQKPVYGGVEYLESEKLNDPTHFFDLIYPSL